MQQRVADLVQYDRSNSEYYVDDSENLQPPTKKLKLLESTV